MSSSSDRTADDWARHLKHHWQARAESQHRDYFVAPQGIEDRESWDAHGEHLANAVLVGLDPAWLKERDLLEIGCGVGRLAPTFAAVAKTYTGVDIAPAMLAEAAQRCAKLPDARFFETDGLHLPAGALDREYGVIMCIAVFVHCAKSVVGQNVEAAWQALAPGGVFRIQVLADPSDPEGVIVPEVGEQGLENFREEAQKTDPTQLELIDEHYMGHAFRYAECREFLQGLTGPDVRLHREELTCIYASLHKPV